MKIIFTGGGTGGHVIPNISIINELKKKEKDLEIIYIGSKTGIEKELITNLGITYKEISTGKFRRDKKFGKENFNDIFNVFRGIKEAKNIIKEEKPDLVFSKGGFVSVPVVIGAKKNKVPVIIHESDITPGLANKLAIPFASKVCVTFPETTKMVGNKGILTGSPVREEILKGSKEAGLKFTGLSGDKKVILVFGGSLGAARLNDAIKENLDDLLKTYDIVNICGKGKKDDSLDGKKGFVQYEFIDKELPDLFALCDLIISRAGAGSIYEILALAKPNILVPLSRRASRGDQILNANSFALQGFSMVIEEEDMSKEKLLDTLSKLEENKELFINEMKKTNLNKANENIIKVIKDIYNERKKK